MPSGVFARTLIEENPGGRWTIVPSPTVAGGSGSVLAGVACATTTHCIAVGSSEDLTSTPLTLIEENTGSGWAIVPSPNPIAFGHGIGYLAGVTCATATHCMAVGAYVSDSGHSQTLIEETTGGGWSIVPSPNTSSGEDNSLSSLACDARRCIAVGSRGYSKTLIEENTGSGWTIVPSPNSTAGYDTTLNSLACIGAGGCIAVGSSSPAYFAALPFVVESAGSGWSATPNPIFNGGLDDVTCVSLTNCIAIGNLFTGGSVIEQRAGNAWMLLPGLSLDTREINGMNLSGVACTGGDRCFIVGDQFIGYGAAHKTLIAEIAGAGWKLVTSPNFF